MTPPVDDPHVLVAFYSRGGLTERLAVLIAEGAIQGGAAIRLRRARDTAPEDVVAATPGWQAMRDRMHAEYAEPRLADVEWADAIAFGTPAGIAGLSAELGSFLDQLGVDAAGKRRVGESNPSQYASAFTSTYLPGLERDASEAALQARLLQAGFIVAPAIALGSMPLGDDYERARAHGRWLARLARGLKASG